MGSRRPAPAPVIEYQSEFASSTLARAHPPTLYETGDNNYCQPVPVANGFSDASAPPSGDVANIYGKVLPGALVDAQYAVPVPPSKLRGRKGSFVSEGNLYLAPVPVAVNDQPQFGMEYQLFNSDTGV